MVTSAFSTVSLLRSARAFAHRSRARSSLRRRDVRAPWPPVDSMQESAQRQCATEAPVGIFPITICKPSAHALVLISGMYSSRTRATPPGALYMMRKL
eukprot:7383782-Prymnesium_polylepis.2